MPLTRSAKKKVRQTARQIVANRITKKKYRDAIRAVKDAVAKKDLTAAAKALPMAFKQVDIAAKKHVMHWKTAARRKSMLAHLVQPAKK